MTEQWIGPILGPVPIKLDGELTDTDMSAIIDIAMPNMNIVVVIGEPIQSGIGQVAVRRLRPTRRFIRSKRCARSQRLEQRAAQRHLHRGR